MDFPEIDIDNKCKDCPILDYCLEKINELSELPNSSDNEAHIKSYAKFYDGIYGECNDGPEITKSRKFLVGKVITKITCGSTLSRVHQDIRTKTKD